MGRPIILAAIAVVLVAVTTGCGDGQDDPTYDPEDLNMTAGDFECIRNLEQPSGGGVTYYFTNLRGNIEEARSVANSPSGGTFPPGTVIQVLPGEAMVKRAVGWNSSTNDWEFFKLRTSEQGTEIRSRGTESVRNIAGTCFSCHSEADEQWDLICVDDDLHGCIPVPFGLGTDDVIRRLQCNDPRCDQPCEWEGPNFCKSENAGTRKRWQKAKELEKDRHTDILIEEYLETLALDEVNRLQAVGVVTNYEEQKV